ncbi:Serine/threonine-protein kinase, active site [Sesbania bispinosa]|nr:Serine/threonine-protein kinase, active site [Sesbania bispinosa]
MVFLQTLFFLLLVHPILTFGHPSHSLQTDKAALLEFKRTIISDPNSSLANWDEAIHVCNFTGVECDEFHHRVIRLLLYDNHLVGPFSPVLSNLTGLHIIEIVNSHLFGIIPPELSSLTRLHHIRLQGNNLHGSIPHSFSQLSKLRLLHIKESHLTGSLPPSLFSNCTLLDNVDLSSNSLSGRIPQEIGNCHALWSLTLYNNHFTGHLPISLTNLSIENIDVEYNYLSGELPTKLVTNWPYLVYLQLSYNNMTSHDNNTNLDPFFIALRNSTALEELELAGMDLGGRFSNTVVSQLAPSLRTLLLQENQIFGSIPHSIANLSSLSILNLTFNLLNGTISHEICSLPYLEQLFLSHNLFKTSIPEALGNCPHLGLLDLSHNEFSGRIPESLGNLVRLNYLFLNNNLLSGTIPCTFGKCTNLYKLDLSYNRLTGSIPQNLSGLHEIRIFINLSHNHLEGPLPIELSKLEKVQEIDLSSNYLTGRIFPQIASCIAVSFINFSNNLLQGKLPESLGNLKNLESFDVSRNQLSGLIPETLATIDTLTFLNLSFNNLEGVIPSGGIFNSVSFLSFLGNPHVCGNITGMSLCSQGRQWFHTRLFLIVLILVISISTFLSTICCVTGCKHLKGIIYSNETETGKKQVRPEFISNFPRITYKELSDATRGFDIERLVGSGRFGHVFRGVLLDGTPIAVKVLHLQSGNSTKSFNRECQVLKRIRHRNLIRIITACSLPDFKALVLPYMANGSLESRLYPSSGSPDLSIIQRVNICSDIAEGMAYLHHHSPVRVIHCDLKPSNVLLNDDMTALVSDFGIARLIMNVGEGNGGVVTNMGNSTANFLCGSIGYIAPATRDQSQEVKKMWEIAIGELIELGILCTQDSPSTRPTMLDAADDLDRLKRYLTGDTTLTFASSLGISSSTFGDY